MRDFLDYVYWNTRYLVSRPDFSYLIQGEQLGYDDLCEKLRSSYYKNFTDTKRKVNYYLAEFSLSALKIKGNDKLSKYARSKYSEIEAKLSRAIEKFSTSVRLPAYDEQTRLEYIVEQITLSTLLGFSLRTQYNLLNVCKDIFNLNSAEIKLFDYCIDLYACKLYCVAVSYISSNPNTAKRIFANIFKVSHNAEHIPYKTADKFDYATVKCGEIFSAVDCHGYSRLCYLAQMVTYPNRYKSNTGLCLTIADGVNIFSQFSRYKFTDSIFQFENTQHGLKTHMRLFYRNNSEVRRYTMSNDYNKGRNLSLIFDVSPYLSNGVYEFFKIGGSFCVKMSCAGKVVYYCISGADIDLSPQFSANSNSCALRLSAQIELPKRSKKTFTITTTLCADIHHLTASLRAVKSLEFSAYPRLFIDKPTSEIPYSLKAILFPHQRANNGVVKDNERPPTKKNKQTTIPQNLKYTAQISPPIVPYNNLMKFGDRFSFTIGSQGENATLYKGYETFGGEHVYLIYGKKAVCLSSINPNRQDDCLRYAYFDDEISANLDLSLSATKRYTVTAKTTKRIPLKVLFVFNFTKRKKYSYNNGKFVSADSIFNISCNSTCNYTLSADNFNPRTLEFTATNTLNQSDFLAFYCPLTSETTVEISADKEGYSFQNFLDDCLFSQKLNYCVQKNIYLLDNFLLPVSALSLAGTVFCCSDFLRSYLISCRDTGFFKNPTLPFYTQTGKMIYQKEPFSFSLGAVYYTNYTGDDVFLRGESGDYLRRQLLTTAQNDFDKLIQMLCLKKSFCLFEDNVAFITKFEQLRRSLNEEQSRLGVLLGVLPSPNLSTELLRSIYEDFSAKIDKSWYYVSTLENLYGINMQNGVLSVSPKPSAQSGKMTLFACDKKINLTFSRGKPRTILNGATIYTSISLKSLSRNLNDLTVFY